MGRSGTSAFAVYAVKREPRAMICIGYNCNPLSPGKRMRDGCSLGDCQLLQGDPSCANEWTRRPRGWSVRVRETFSIVHFPVRVRVLWPLSLSLWRSLRHSPPPKPRCGASSRGADTSIRTGRRGGECRGVTKIPIFPSVSAVSWLFQRGSVGNIFDLRENGKRGTVKKWVFRFIFFFIFVHFSPVFLNHIPPQPSTTHVPCAMPDIPPFPPISSIFLHPPPPMLPIPPIFLHYPPIPPLFPDTKIPFC